MRTLFHRLSPEHQDLLKRDRNIVDILTKTYFATSVEIGDAGHIYYTINQSRDPQDKEVFSISGFMDLFND